MINVFEYQNYRVYLQDYYAEQKANKRNFSYRSFSAKAGINASSFLFYVIKGKRNLSKNTIIKISRAIGHSQNEAQYFEYLVFFNQAQSITDKTYYYSRLVEIRRPIDIQQVSKDRYEYYSVWYHSVVREVITLSDFKGDFKKLGSFLIPAITARQAKESVRLLEQMGFIEIDEDGLYHQTENLIFSRPGLVDAFVIEKFQKEMLELAIQSYQKVARGERMSTSTTFSISKPTFDLFKIRLRELQKDLMEMARIDDTQDRAYQLVLNMFPVSRSTDEEF